MEIMPEADKAKYQELQKQLSPDRPKTAERALPVFWTVEVDRQKEQEKSYILTSGDPERPEKNHEVQPGWPFAPAKIEFREGRIEAFSDWLTAPENPLFARVAVNRLWQWHFGEGLAEDAQRFRQAWRPRPSIRRLLDWLASEFVKRNFSMKEMHRLIVTSETYKLASEVDPELVKAQYQDRSEQHLSLAFPPATARSRADLGFDLHRGRQPRPDRGRAVVRHRRWRRPTRRRPKPPAERAPIAGPPT